MKGPLSVALAAIAITAVSFACSSSPSRPPIDNTGGGGNPGGVSEGPKADAATDAAPPTAEDAGTPVTTTDSGNEAGICSAGGCGGCCNALNECVTGTTSLACGVLGVPCVQCMAGSNCMGGYCQ
jgi:hypothetical protein